MPVFQDSIDRRLDCFQFFLIAFAYNSVTNTVIFFFLIVLGLHCCVRAFSSCSEWGLLSVVVFGLLIAVASLVVEHGL